MIFSGFFQKKSLENAQGKEREREREEKNALKMSSLFLVKPVESD